MPSLAAARVIAHVRDPRDCLVSNHYSLAFSHPLPTEAGPIRDKLLADRNIYSSRTVDESVLADCESFSRVFEELNGLNGRIPALYLSKYEDMVADFDGWLDRLCNFTRCGHLTDIKSQIRAGANFNVEENKFNHMRQVSPGDFRRKLSPETQHILTERLAPVLQSLGYSCKL
jgi:hypothetical protein